MTKPQTIYFHDGPSYRQAWLTKAPRIIKPAESLAWKAVTASVVVEGEEYSGVQYDASEVPVAIYGSTRIHDCLDIQINSYRGAESAGDNLALHNVRGFKLTRCEWWHGTDENVAITGACRDGLAEKCVSHSALSFGGHIEDGEEIEHSKGMMITGASSPDGEQGYPDGIKLEEILFALNVARNPNCAGDASGEGGEITLFQVVVFGWGDFGIHASRGARVAADRVLGVPVADSELDKLLLANQGGEIDAHAVFIDKGEGEGFTCLSGETGAQLARAWRQTRKLRRRMKSWGPKVQSQAFKNLLAQIEARQGVPGVPGHGHLRPELWP